MKPRLLILTAALTFAALSLGRAATEIVKDDFEKQKEGESLADLDFWIFYGGWIKPEYGKIVLAERNKFLRMKGDIFTREKTVLSDRLTYKFKIRASGDDREVGGLVLRAGDSSGRYDILFSFANGGVVLVKNSSGTRETIAQGAGVKKMDFNNVVVVVDKLDNGVKFSLTLDGDQLLETTDTTPMPFLEQPFTSGFFTYNDTSIEIDQVEFTSGK